MAEMEDRLNAILGNPQMMQQIMSMAQTLGQTQRILQNRNRSSRSHPDKHKMPRQERSLPLEALLTWQKRPASIRISKPF